MKKLLTLLAALVLCLGLSVPALGADLIIYPVTGGNLYFDPATGTVAGCDFTVTGANIPSEVGGVAVTAIGNGAFYNCEVLTSVTIPGSVASIGSTAFYSCDGLTRVAIPDSVTSIGDWAFRGCESLTSVTLPGGVTSIGAYVFDGCESLTDVHYEGSEEEWRAIGISSLGNDPLLNATIHFGRATPEQTSTAYARTETVDIGGQRVELYAYGLKDENGNYTNYVKLRDIACALNGTAAQFEVGWDGAVNIITGQGYTANGTEMTITFDGDHAYSPSDAAVRLNGAAVELEGICLTGEDGSGYNYYKLRDLGRLLGFNVGWSRDRGIFVEPDKPYTDAD